METVIKKTCLSDSFESQKRAAKSVANGLLLKEIRPDKSIPISDNDVKNAKDRGKIFLRKYSIK